MVFFQFLSFIIQVQFPMFAMNLEFFLVSSWERLSYSSDLHAQTIHIFTYIFIYYTTKTTWVHTWWNCERWRLNMFLSSQTLVWHLQLKQLILGNIMTRKNTSLTLQLLISVARTWEINKSRKNRWTNISANIYFTALLCTSFYAIKLFKYYSFLLQSNQMVFVRCRNDSLLALAIRSTSSQ